MTLTEFNEAEFVANRLAEGRAEGRLDALFELVKDGVLQLTEAVNRSSLTKEAFLEEMQKAGY